MTLFPCPEGVTVSGEDCNNFVNLGHALLCLPGGIDLILQFWEFHGPRSAGERGKGVGAVPRCKFTSGSGARFRQIQREEEAGKVRAGWG